tara:strand:- start:448 stop:654 length:207 start_codon:yes stop_codon:yes gene_type:complete
MTEKFFIAKIMTIEINADDTIARVNGIEEPIQQVHEFSYGPCEVTTLILEDGREFESFDDCETWDEKN